MACRIPLSTCHSQIAKWCGNKPRVLVLNRLDMISERDRVSWTRHFNAAGTHVCWTDGVSGLGTGQVCGPLLLVLMACVDLPVLLTGVGTLRQEESAGPHTPLRWCARLTL